MGQSARRGQGSTGRPGRSPGAAPWALVALLAGCGARMEPGGHCVAPAAPPGYAAEVAPMLAVNCASCHHVGAANRGGAPVGVNYDTYANAKLYGEMGSQDAVSGRMPPNSPLDRDTACILYSWVHGGFLP